MKQLKELFDLNGKNALVTGSSQGIGKAIALGLAEFGANVMVHYNTGQKLAEQTVKELEQYKVRSGMVSANLAKQDAADIIYNACCSQLGGIDILIQNASIQIRKPWTEVNYEEYRFQTDVNIGSTLWLIQKFVSHMQKKKWGRIITIGSVQQNRPHPDMIVYSATKMAIVNMVKSLAPSLGKDGITVNNLAPGVIITQRNEKPLADEAYANKVLNTIPAGYFGESIDCVGLVVLLSSDAGRYITGTDLLVDGGMSLP